MEGPQNAYDMQMVLGRALDLCYFYIKGNNPCLQEALCVKIC